MDIATLALAVDSSGLLRAKPAFDRFTTGAHGAEVAATKFGNATRTMNHNVANAAAQFQDIAVSLQGGQGFLQVALQQGTQLGAVLGATGGGLRGAVGALGAAFVSVLSPVNLITIGLIAATGAAYQFFSTSESAAERSAKAFKEHENLIGRIKDTYGEAASSLTSMSAEWTEKLLSDARSGLSQLGGEAREFNKTLLDTITGVSIQDIGNGITPGPLAEITVAIDEYKEFEGAILSLRRGIQDGNPDFRAFYETVDRISNADPSGALRKSGDALIKLTTDSYNAERAMDSARLAITTIGSAASAQIKQVNDLAAAMKTLAGISLPNFSDTEVAKTAYDSAMKNAGGIQDRIDAAIAYGKALKRISDMNPTIGGSIVPTPESRPQFELDGPYSTASSSGSKTSAYNDATKSLAERTEALQAQQAAQASLNPIVTDYSFAVTKAKEQAALLAAAERDKLALTPALTAEIDRQSTAYANATVAVNKQAEAFKAAQEELSFYKSAGGSFLTSFRQTWVETGSAIDAAKSALSGFFDTFMQRLEQMAADRLITSLLGGIFGAPSLGTGGIGAIIGSGSGYFPPAPSLAAALPASAKFAPLDVRVSVDDKGAIQTYVGKRVAASETKMAIANEARLGRFKKRELHDEVAKHMRDPRGRG